MAFEDKIEEALSYGTGSYMNLSELRMLYYGRRDLYVSFTDKGEYYIDTQSDELDRPHSILCYAVNDVVARKASSSEFYANVFRINMNNGIFLDNISQYNRDDLKEDLTMLRMMDVLESGPLEYIIDDIMKDTTIRTHFAKMWNITEFVSKRAYGSEYEKNWRKMLMNLGYIGFADQTGSGLFTGDRTPAVIYLDYTDRTDLDIMPIQKTRVDPRRRVRDAVMRKVERMSTVRNRISKKRIDPSERFNVDNSISPAELIKLFQGF